MSTSRHEYGEFYDDDRFEVFEDRLHLLAGALILLTALLSVGVMAAVACAVLV